MYLKCTVGHLVAQSAFCFALSKRLLCHEKRIYICFLFTLRVHSYSMFVFGSSIWLPEFVFPTKCDTLYSLLLSVYCKRPRAMLLCEVEPWRCTVQGRRVRAYINVSSPTQVLQSVGFIYSRLLKLQKPGFNWLFLVLKNVIKSQQQCVFTTNVQGKQNPLHVFLEEIVIFSTLFLQRGNYWKTKFHSPPSPHEWIRHTHRFYLELCVGTISELLWHSSILYLRTSRLFLGKISVH